MQLLHLRPVDCVDQINIDCLNMDSDKLLQGFPYWGMGGSPPPPAENLLISPHLERPPPPPVDSPPPPNFYSLSVKVNPPITK